MADDIEAERLARMNRKVDQRLSKDPLTRTVNSQSLDTPAGNRVPTYELMPQRKTDEDYARAGRHAASENARRSEEISTYKKGGMVKAGSPKVTAPCADTKTLKCFK